MHDLLTMNPTAWPAWWCGLATCCCLSPSSHRYNSMTMLNPEMLSIKVSGWGGEGGGDDWGRILGRNPDKSLKSFPPYYSQSPKQFCLEISISSNAATYNIKLRYNVREKVWKPERKPYPLLYGLRDSFKKRNLKSENSHDYVQKPRRNCTFMNSASG